MLQVLAGEALQLGQMLGAFMLAAMGLGLATLMFLGEKVLSRITEAKTADEQEFSW